MEVNIPSRSLMQVETRSQCALSMALLAIPKKNAIKNMDTHRVGSQDQEIKLLSIKLKGQ